MKTKSEAIRIFDPVKDRLVEIKYAKLKEPIVPNLNATDTVRAPILEFLARREHELDPERICIFRGKKRAECDVYDSLAKIVGYYQKHGTRGEKKKVVARRQMAFLSHYPRYCGYCVFAEHRRRKRENAWYRRLVRWLKRIQSR